jgi:hypothetical protein
MVQQTLKEQQPSPQMPMAQKIDRTLWIEDLAHFSMPRLF